MKYSYVYVLASKRNGTLYIGVTEDLIKRVYEHKNKLIDGFTKKYNVHMLVYYEQFEDIESAILREKQVKKWNRKWKLELIEKTNSEWRDLFEELSVQGKDPWIPNRVGNDVLLCRLLSYINKHGDIRL